MTARETLLRGVFEALDHANVKFCVSRNVTGVFEEGSSDVDLLIEPRNLERAFVASCEAATAAGFRLISRTRFANMSLVFWQRGGFLLRIDFETEIRWRIWPVMTADEVLKDITLVHGVPAASEAAEIAILVTKTLWAGKITARYRGRLGELTKPEIVRHGLLPPSMVQLAFTGQIGRLRRMVIGRALMNPQVWPILIGNIFHDACRFLGRLWHPPGVCLSARVSLPLSRNEIEDRLEMAFPPAKAVWANDNSTLKNTARALFRGGLVVQEIVREEPAAFHKARARKPGFWMSRRQHRFELIAPPGCGCFLGHSSTGRIWSVSLKNQAADITDGIAEAMASSLHTSKCQPRSGTFTVLVGLDGAGKTTFARNLCQTPPEHTGFDTIRYFHWMPKRGNTEFPWPTTVETSRKAPRSGPLASLVSLLRLCRHLIQARLRHALVTAPAVRRGELVIVDRFLYNYWLDPASVKYSGPAWGLRLASLLMPKPDLILSLEADADTILSRKNELTREEIVTQTYRLHHLPLRGSRFVIINAAQSPDEVIDNAISALRE
jgi:thymidylate kinase